MPDALIDASAWVGGGECGQKCLLNVTRAAYIEAEVSAGLSSRKKRNYSAGGQEHGKDEQKQEAIEMN